MDNLTNHVSGESATAPKLNIRETILTHKSKYGEVEAFGHKIQLRPPLLTELTQYREWQSDEYLLVRAMINHCYDPATGQKVFEETDLEVLGAKEFDGEMKKLNGAIQKMLGDDTTIVAKIEDDTKSPEA